MPACYWRCCYLLPGCLLRLQERIVQVVGSIGVTAVLSKSAAIAAPALLYPIWGPWLRAGARNLELYAKQFKYVGLWRAQLLSIQVASPSYYGSSPYSRDTEADREAVTVTVGDPWDEGARAQLVFPYQEGCERLRAGASSSRAGGMGGFGWG